MPSLRELQRAFADTVLAPVGTAPAFAIAGGTDAAERIGIYRNAVFANYRKALAASYPVVLRLVGAPFFNTAVDAFVRAHPSASGDLNVYGSTFGGFLAAYPYAAGLPYLADVARLEWAIDEARQAANCAPAPDRLIAALAATAPERLPSLRFELDPSCRLVASAFPVLRIWQVNQPVYEGDEAVDLDAGADPLLVRRTADGDVAIARVPAGEHAFLSALARGDALGAAIDAASDAAMAAGAEFDLGAVLQANIGAGVLVAVAAD